VGARKGREKREDMMRLRVEAGLSLAWARVEIVLGQILRGLLVVGVALLVVGLAGHSVATSLGLGRLVKIGLALSVGAIVLLAARGWYTLRVVRKVRWQDGTVTIRTIEPGNVGESGQHVVCEVELKPTARAFYEAQLNPTPRAFYEAQLNPSARILRVATTVGPLDIQRLVVGTTMP
jgi:hypothetical protein